MDHAAKNLQPLGCGEFARFASRRIAAKVRGGSKPSVIPGICPNLRRSRMIQSGREAGSDRGIRGRRECGTRSNSPRCPMSQILRRINHPANSPRLEKPQIPPALNNCFPTASRLDEISRQFNAAHKAPLSKGANLPISPSNYDPVFCNGRGCKDISVKWSSPHNVSGFSVKAYEHIAVGPEKYFS